jgi:hypothetical protein
MFALFSKNSRVNKVLDELHNIGIYKKNISIILKSDNKSINKTNSKISLRENIMQHLSSGAFLGGMIAFLPKLINAPYYPNLQFSIFPLTILEKEINFTNLFTFVLVGILIGGILGIMVGSIAFFIRNTRKTNIPNIKTNNEEVLISVEVNLDIQNKVKQIFELNNALEVITINESES